MGRRILTGAAWSTAATFLTRAIAFVATIVVARVLGREAFGRFGIINATLLSFNVLGTLGMGVAATKLVAQNRRLAPELAGRALASTIATAVVTGGVVALGLALGAPWLAAHVLDDAGLTTALRLGACAVFFTSWSTAQTGGLSGLEDFASVARISVLSGLVSVAFTIAGALRFGFNGAVAALPIAAGLQCVFQEAALRRALKREGIPFGYRHARSELSRAFAVGIPATVSASLFMPTSWICSALLVNHGGYGEMAAFAATEQWFNLILMLPMVMGGVILPVLTNVFAANDAQASRRILRKTFLLNGVVSWLPLLVLAPLGPFLLRLYGTTYVEAWPTMVMMIAAACLASSLAPAGYALTATGELWWASLMNLGWAVAYLGGAYVFLVLLGKGAFGLATARLTAYGFHAVWSLLYLRAVLGRGANGLVIRR